MKKLLFILLTTSLITFAQDFQVSQMNGYSVDLPHIATAGTSVHMIYGTNYNYYNFDINGPASPIDNPITPSDNYGPNTVDIAVDSTNDNHIAIAYYDYHYDYNNDGVPFYGCYVVESIDGGENWDTPTLLDTIELGNSLSNVAYNLPRVVLSQGSIYILWRVNINSVDTNAVYISERYGNRNRIDNPNTNDLEIAIELTVEYNSESSTNIIAVSYGKMDDSHVKFYLAYSTSGLPDYSNTVMVKDDGQTFLTSEHFTKVFINSNGVIKYIYTDFAHSPQLTHSSNWGATWLDQGTVESHKYIYVAIERIPSQDNLLPNYYVKLLYNDNSDLVFSVSNDLLNWQYGGKINSDDAQVAGWAGSFIDFKFDSQNKNIISAWIDNRTGNEEIFYSKTPLPQIVGVNDKNELPIEFSLMQNYPNPFNPSTAISFALPKEANVKVEVFNSIGEKVAELLNGNMSAGYHLVNFTSANFSSGLYFYRISAGHYVEVKKMMMIK